MRLLSCTILAVVLSTAGPLAAQQTATRTLVAVLAHADDEAPIAPILARYAREGARVYMIVTTDGAQGGANNSIPRGPQLARVREEEARCAARALGAQPPVLLGFPDGKLGDYLGDRTLLYRLTQRLAAELARLRPDAVLTWGPDGGYGHPDHRLVSDLVVQLQRAGAPGVPERVYYMYLPEEGIRAMNPERGAPPFVIPQARYFTVKVPFAPQDLRAAQRAMACHRTQYTDETVQRVFPVQARALNGVVSLVPAFPSDSGTDVFR
jgi:LmbE family N-acetylglucosaminyl deacetylase